MKMHFLFYTHGVDFSIGFDLNCFGVGVFHSRETYYDDDSGKQNVAHVLSLCVFGIVLIRAEWSEMGK